MSTHALQNYTQCFIFRVVFSKSGGVHDKCSKGEGGRGRGERGEIRGGETGALTLTLVLRIIHSYRVCNGVQPSQSSILHSRNFVSVRSLPEMSAVCHNVAEITCGRAAHTGFALPVAPQMKNVEWV